MRSKTVAKYVSSLFLIIAVSSTCSARSEQYNAVFTGGQIAEISVIEQIGWTLVMLFVCIFVGALSAYIGFSIATDKNDRESKELRKKSHEEQDLIQRTATLLQQIDQNLINVLPDFDKIPSKLFLDRQGNLRGKNQ